MKQSQGTQVSKRLFDNSFKFQNKPVIVVLKVPRRWFVACQARIKPISIRKHVFFNNYLSTPNWASMCTIFEIGPPFWKAKLIIYARRCDVGRWKAKHRVRPYRRMSGCKVGHICHKTSIVCVSDCLMSAKEHHATIYRSMAPHKMDVKWSVSCLWCAFQFDS